MLYFLSHYILLSLRIPFLQSLIIALFLVFPLSFVHGFELPMRHYTADEGLVQNDVITVLQGHKGYLWFGTYGGVSRFDGKNFTNYDEESGLQGTIVRSLIEDSEKCLWAGYNGGIGRLEKGHFIHYGAEQGLMGEDMHQLWPAPHGGIWVVTEAGVNYFDGAAFTFYPLKGITATNYSFIAGDKEEKVFIASEKGVYAWMADTKQFILLPAVTFPVVALHYCHHEECLYLINNTTVYKLKNNKLTVEAQSPLEMPLIDFFIGKNSWLWLFSSAQLWYYTPKEQHVYSSRNIQEASISGGIEDREGNIWLTRWGGVSIILDSQIQNYRKHLAGKIATSLAKDSQGNLWVAGEHGVVQLKESGKLLLEVETSYVEDFLLDEHAERLYAGTEEGVHVFDFKGELLHVVGPAQTITRVRRDSKGKIWVGTYNGLFSLKDKDLVLENDIQKGLRSNVIWSILEDKEGVLWVGTEKGLSCFDGQGWNHYAKEGLSHYTIWALLEHPEWGFLIGTSKGITTLTNGTFAQMPIVKKEKIHSLGVDGHGKLWVGTLKGLFRFNKKMEQEIFLDKLLGLTSNSVYNNRMFFDNSHVYVGTHAGVSRIETDITRVKTAGPLLDIYSLDINHQPYHLSDFPSELEYFYRNLTFYFNSIYMYLPQKVQYRYYLSDMENEWGPFKSISQAVYTNLSHGHYVFKVQAFAENNKHSPVNELQFTIKKPFWLNTWFIIAEIMAALLFGAALVRIVVSRKVRKSEAEKKRIQSLYEKQLRLDKLKDEFLANTSHELRTPLNGIIGITESLIDGSTGPLQDDTKTNLSMIVSSGRRLANLVNDILDFSKMRNQDLNLDIRPVDIRCIADVVITLTGPLIGQKPVTLKNNIPHNLSLVLGDENRIHQILSNLIDNAIKFTHEGEVIISVQQDAENMCVSVSDTGIGIAKDKQESIFETFEQAEGSIAREYGGTGLGLAVTKKLVELHKGRIWLESEPGKGAVFFFTIPIAKGAQIEYTPAPEQAEARIVQKFAHTTEAVVQIEDEGKEYLNTVMVVDDETVNLQVLKNFLGSYYRVLIAQDGFGALSILEGEKPDLIVLDIMMPRMSGFELTSRIRQTYDASKLPILLLTAKNQITDLVQGMNSGANDYLIKPFNKDELICRIKTHLRLTHINRAYERFVPHEFLEFLRRESIIDVRLGDCVEETMTVMFADIRAFTTISERMNPQKNFDFLNDYLSYVGPVIRQHKGFIDKYIGDAIMSLFIGGADDALKAAVEMFYKLEKFNEKRQNKGLAPISIGIGINTGSLMLGIIGEHNRMEGTVISDAVNLASRIEGMTKLYGAQLLITEETLKSLPTASQYNKRIIDRVKVKGKKQIVTVWEVFDGNSEEVIESKIAIMLRFEQALSLYFEGKLSDAQKLFKECLTQYPDDQASRVYVERCEKYIKGGYDEPWDGVTQLENK